MLKTNISINILRATLDASMCYAAKKIKIAIDFANYALKLLESGNCSIDKIKEAYDAAYEAGDDANTATEAVSMASEKFHAVSEEKIIAAFSALLKAKRAHRDANAIHKILCDSLSNVTDSINDIKIKNYTYNIIITKAVENDAIKTFNDAYYEEFNTIINN